MNEEDKGDIDRILESLGLLLDGLDLILETLTLIAKKQSIEEQEKFKKGISMILDHIKNTSEEYTT